MSDMSGFRINCEPDVNHPPHYHSKNFEVIDIIEDFELGFCLGNVIKYVLRAGKKSSETCIKDLNKAAWYLNRHIESLRKLENK